MTVNDVRLLADVFDVGIKPRGAVVAEPQLGHGPLHMAAGGPWRRGSRTQPGRAGRRGASRARTVPSPPPAAMARGSTPPEATAPIVRSFGLRAYFALEDGGWLVQGG